MRATATPSTPYSPDSRALHHWGLRAAQASWAHPDDRVRCFFFLDWPGRSRVRGTQNLFRGCSVSRAQGTKSRGVQNLRAQPAPSGPCGTTGQLRARTKGASTSGSAPSAAEAGGRGTLPATCGRPSLFSFEPVVFSNVNIVDLPDSRAAMHGCMVFFFLMDVLDSDI